MHTCSCNNNAINKVPTYTVMRYQQEKNDYDDDSIANIVLNLYLYSIIVSYVFILLNILYFQI